MLVALICQSFSRMASSRAPHPLAGPVDIVLFENMQGDDHRDGRTHGPRRGHEAGLVACSPGELGAGLDGEVLLGVCAGVDHGVVMSTEVDPVEYEDRWVLNLHGLSVVRISIDVRLTLVLEAGWDVSPEAPARLSAGSLRADPGVLLTSEAQDVAGVLPLFGTKVLSAVAFKSGALRMVFAGGTHLNRSPNASFEAWQITEPRGWRFVSLPGGDLAVWSRYGTGEDPQDRTAKPCESATYDATGQPASLRKTA
ncbi:DUF6188 family protein [Streptomyces sp. NPDC051020]|uniref:DUF6188 family protein n=1 Tax=Streptomyces sp. NPDC051020 TaxID=3155409 RepID=UPI0034198D6A